MRAFVRRAVAMVLALSLVPSFTGLGACETVPGAPDAPSAHAHGGHEAGAQAHSHSVPPHSPNAHAVAEESDGKPLAAAPADDCCPEPGAPSGHCAMAAGCLTIAAPVPPDVSAPTRPLARGGFAVNTNAPPSPTGDLDVPPPRS